MSNNACIVTFGTEIINDRKYLKLSFEDIKGNKISHLITNTYDFINTLHDKKLKEGWT